MKSKVFQKSFAITMILVMIFSFAFVSSPSALAKSAKKKSVTVSKVAVTNLTKGVLYVAKGKTVAIKTEVKGAKKANKKVTYKTKSQKIAKVNKKGVVKGVKIGKTKITVTSKANKKKKATVKVQVTAPAKSVKLNKTSGSLNVGSKTTLKATVAGKGAAKAVKFTSSNEKVASVDKNGVVTAKTAGNAVITAKTVDGTNKKATCKITVIADTTNPTQPSEPQNNKTNLVSLTYIPVGSNGCLRVKFNKKVSLNKDNFKVKAKQFEKGNYIFDETVDFVITYDKLNYIIELDDCSPNYYYQLTVSGIDGINTAEVYATQKDNEINNKIVCGRVGDSLSTSLGFSEISGLYKTEIISGSLPNGFELDDYNYISGKSTEVVDNKVVVVRATNELGQTITTNVTFIIGDDKTMVAENPTFNYNLYAYNDSSEEFYVDFTDIGSGSYDVAFAENKYKDSFALGSVGNKSFEIRIKTGDLKAGTYTVKVKITDKSDSNISAVSTVTFVVLPSVKVSVELKNLDFNNYYCYETIGLIDMDNGTTIELELKQLTDANGNKYYRYVGYGPKGNYTVVAMDAYGITTLQDELVIDKDTDLVYSYPESAGELNVSIVDENNQKYAYQTDFKVRIVNNDSNMKFDFGSSLPYNSEKGCFVVPKIPCGNYEITVESAGQFFGSDVTFAKTNVTLTKKDVTSIEIKVNVNDIIPKTIANITEPSNVEVSCAARESKFIKFTPKESGSYKVYSKSNYDTLVHLYDANGSYLSENDDGGENNNFSLTYDLEAGKDYYYEVECFSNKDCTMTVYFEKAE